MFKSDQINELAIALAKAQLKLKTAKKEAEGYSYNYSDLATVVEVAKSVLPENGLSYTQLLEESTEGKVSVTTVLMHNSGQFIGSTASIKIPEMNKINDTQKAGAAASYLRRYALQAIIGMASEDNDAASEQKPVSKTSNIPVKKESEVKAEVSAQNATQAEAKKKISFKTSELSL